MPILVFIFSTRKEEIIPDLAERVSDGVFSVELLTSYDNFSSYNTSEAGQGPFSFNVSTQGVTCLLNGDKDVVWSFSPANARLGLPETTVSVDDSGRISIKVHQSQQKGKGSWSWRYPAGKTPSERL